MMLHRNYVSYIEILTYLSMFVLRHVRCCNMNMYAMNMNGYPNISLFSDEVITAEFEDM